MEHESASYDTVTHINYSPKIFTTKKNKPKQKQTKKKKPKRTNKVFVGKEKKKKERNCMNIFQHVDIKLSSY